MATITKHQTKKAERTKKIDIYSDTTTYVGEAKIGAGSSGASAIWKIKRIFTNGTVTTVAYADGNTRYDNIWDNRTTITYS